MVIEGLWALKTATVEGDPPAKGAQREGMRWCHDRAVGRGEGRAEAGVAAVTGGSETRCDFHSWFLGQTSLLSVQPLLRGFLVLCSARMLKPSGFKASVGSSLTPCGGHRRKSQG